MSRFFLSVIYVVIEKERYMNIFDAVKNNTSGKVIHSKDYRGGSSLLPSNIYSAVIKGAYYDKSPKGAYYVSLRLALNVDGKAREYTEKLYISKFTGEFFYKTADGKESVLMGMELLESLSMLVNGKKVADADVQNKQIQITTANGTELVTRECIVDLLNKPIQVGIIQERKLHWEKEKADAGETVTTNAINKFFNKDDFTCSELEDVRITKPEYKTYWINTFKDQVVDRTKSKSSGATSNKTQGSSQNTSQASTQDTKGSLDDLDTLFQ